MNKIKDRFFSESEIAYINDHFARRLKKGLELREENIKGFAKEVDLSRSVIYKYLNQEINPSIDTVSKVAYALEVPFEFFSQDHCEIGDYVYLWDNDDLMIKVRDKDNHQRNYQAMITRGKSEPRKTDDDYSFFQLLSMRADNKQAQNSFVKLLNQVEKQVDESTRSLITALLIDTSLELAKIKKEYDSFVKEQENKKE